MKYWIMLLAISLSNLGFSAGDAKKGKNAYALCSTCHGQKGEGIKAMNGPKLAGQDDWYLIRQIKNFKDGIRGTNPKDVYGAQMRPMSMTLANDQAIEDVVAYIGTFK